MTVLPCHKLRCTPVSPLHVAGHNLSLLMRQLIGAGTPREAVARGCAGRAAPDEGDTTTLSKTLAKAEANLGIGGLCASLHL